MGNNSLRSCFVQNSVSKFTLRGSAYSAKHRGTLLYPGVAGGMNWGSVAIDEINNLMVVNSMHNPNVVRLFQEMK